MMDRTAGGPYVVATTTDGMPRATPTCRQLIPYRLRRQHGWRWDSEVDMKADARLGVARLALRGVIGSTMIAHGVKHARSLEGTAGWFNSIGFREAELQAKASAG